MGWRGRTALSLLMLGVVAATPALATVTVWFDAQDSNVAPGENVDVVIMAEFSDAIIAWGIDLTIADESVATLVDIDIADPPWVALPRARDGDGLAGIAFPEGVSGITPLATLTFLGGDIGTTAISLSYDLDDEAEGFALDPPPDELDLDVTFIDGTITVPEPGSLALFALCGLAALRRR